MYPSYEILIIENNSTEEATFSYYKELEAQGIRVLKYPKQGFNYSAINNFGVKEAKGEYLLFLNNDMEIITPDFMEKMVSNLQRPQIGAVGAKLYYPDNTVQHAGIIIGIGGIAGHAFLGLARGRSGYLHKASLQMNVSAVTAACMMMKKRFLRRSAALKKNCPSLSMMLICACALEKQVIKSYTIRTWSCTIMNRNPGEQRMTRRRCAASSRKSNLCAAAGLGC